MFLILNNPAMPTTTLHDSPPLDPAYVKQVIQAQHPDVWGLCADGEHLCSGCMKVRRDEVVDATEHKGSNPQWELVGWVVGKDRTGNRCAHCYKGVW